MKSFSSQDNFYKRLRELSNVDAPTKSTSLDRQTLIDYVRATDGTAIGIIKEDTNFFIKSSLSKGDLGVEHFTYIGGLENKLKYKYNSLSEAEKIRGYFVSSMNENLSRSYNPAKTINEEKELLSKTNAEKGEVANAQDVADKAAKGASLKKSAETKEVGVPVSKEGVANAQSTADKKKSDDASAKLNKKHEPSTASGKSREDIAKAQTNADSQEKGDALKKAAHEKEIAKPTAKSGGEAKAQAEADKNKSEDKGVKNKVEGHKEVKPASDAKKEKAIVAEHFGEPEVAPEEPGADAEVSADAAGAEMSPSAEGDLDAAASALDDLDIKAQASDAEGGSSAEVPVADEPGSEEPSANGGDEVSGGPDTGVADDGALHDIEKLVGKVGQKVRSTEIPDEMVSGFLKSFLSAFDGKLADLDSEEKKELADKILKAGEEGDEFGGKPDAEASSSTEEEPGAEPDAENSPSAEPGAENGHEEKEVDENGMGMAEPSDEEIEEAINQHLAEMGKANEGGVTDSGAGVGSAGAAPATGAQPAMGASQHPNSFKKYMAERGYNAENENISIMEMVSLVNGYANEHCGDADDYSNADMQTIAEYMSPEVKKGVTESGFGKFAEGVEVFSVKPKAYKSAEPVVEYGDEHHISTADAVNAMPMKEEKEKEEEGKVEESHVEEEKAKVEENKKKVGFAKEAESMTKKAKEEESKKVDENKTEVSESTKTKLRLIINNKIQEQLGLKKKSLTESAKSNFSKKLDEMVAAEISKNKELLKKYTK